MMMIAEILAIGDELVSGQRLDTNSAWLSERLCELGVRVSSHTSVGDELAAIANAFRWATGRADVVVSTGGLGPTADDLTRQALAEITGFPLQRNVTALRHIHRLFARRGRPMPPQNEIQAMFPRGSRMIANPHGTAPGIELDVVGDQHRTSRIIALPGIPAEMRQMWHESVEQSLCSIGAGRRIIRHRRIKCFGVGESDLEQMLPDLIRRGRVPSVGITVHQATITLRVTAEGESIGSCDELTRGTVQTIRDCLGNLVFGEEDDELQHVVLRHLGREQASLSTVEWGSDGLLASWLRSADATDRVYCGGLVISSLAALKRALKSDDLPDLEPAGASSELTRQMALRLGACMGTDYALAVGPPPSGEPNGEKGNLPRISIAVASKNGAVVESHPFTGHPDVLMARSAKCALNCLRLLLQTSSPNRA